MIIRPYKIEDLEAISTIYEQYYRGEYELPNLDRTLTNAVVEVNGQITGFGLVKLWSEAVMVLDKSRSVRVKVNTFDALMNHALKASQHYKMDKIYAVVADPRFQGIMEKHFDFKPIENTVLEREITDG